MERIIFIFLLYILHIAMQALKNKKTNIGFIACILFTRNKKETDTEL